MNIYVNLKFGYKMDYRKSYISSFHCCQEEQNENCKMEILILFIQYLMLKLENEVPKYLTQSQSDTFQMYPEMLEK